MWLTYQNLDAETPRLMVEKIELDVQAGTSYISNSLAVKAQTWVSLLKQAIMNSDDIWLAAQLRAPGVLKHEAEREEKRKHGNDG